MNSSELHEYFVGKPGQASKTIGFKEEDFKIDLAPTNAKIEYSVINGEKFVTMTYKV